MYPVRQSFSANEDLAGFGEVGYSGGGFFGVAAWHWRCVYSPDWLLFAYFVFIDDAPAHSVCCQTTFNEAIAECAVSSKKANAGSSPPLLQSQHKLHRNLLPQVSHMCVPAPPLARVLLLFWLPLCIAGGFWLFLHRQESATVARRCLSFHLLAL